MLPTGDFLTGMQHSSKEELMDSLCKTAETAAASSPAVMTDASTGPTGTSLPPAGPAGTLPTPTGPTGTSPTRPTGRTRATPHSSGTRSPSEVAAAVVGGGGGGFYTSHIII
jgi:hypothetical protein